MQAEKLLGLVDATKQVDIIVLGEMALLRYKYKDDEEVAPWSEEVPACIEAIEAIKD